jgi:putative ABC transport system substrate-binding protein
MWYRAVGCLVTLTLGMLMVPLAAHAQPARLPRLGYLALRAGPAPEDAVFTQGLRDLGWIEGQNLAIEYRWAAGQVDRLLALAEELVRRWIASSRGPRRWSMRQRTRRRRFLLS